MRISISPHGTPEIAKAGALACLAAVPLAYASPWAALVPFGAWLGVAAFFRDPERAPSGGAEDLVSPADGRVTDVVDVAHPFVGPAARRIGIFLSVFDVHVNRSPAAGRVEHLQYKPGAFRDARHPDASRVNESNEIGLVTPDGARLLVRQVSGAIARRIVCAARVGQTVARGERIGMIKFGSRTELYADPARYDILVREGDVVRGGETVLARRRDPFAAGATAAVREAP